MYQIFIECLPDSLSVVPWVLWRLLVLRPPPESNCEILNEMIQKTNQLKGRHERMHKWIKMERTNERKMHKQNSLLSYHFFCRFNYIYIYIGSVFAYFLISLFAPHTPTLVVTLGGALFQSLIASLMQVFWVNVLFPISHILPFVHALVTLPFLFWPCFQNFNG